jgi:hypothetical protein
VWPEANCQQLFTIFLKRFIGLLMGHSDTYFATEQDPSGFYILSAYKLLEIIPILF